MKNFPVLNIVKQVENHPESVPKCFVATTKAAHVKALQWGFNIVIIRFINLRINCLKIFIV